MELTNFDHETIAAEYAKSSRSECRGCSQKIEKDDLRLGHCVYFDPDEEFNNKKYYHLKCFSIPPRIKNLTLNEIEGIEEINPGDQDEILNKLKIPRGEKRKKPQKSNKESSEKKEENLYSIDLRSLKDCKGYTKSQLEEVIRIREDMEGKKNDQLIAMLKFNGRAGSGPKSVLAMKIADQTVLGVMPPCPSCGGPFLRWNFIEGKYTCKGYLDDVDYVKCGLTFEKDKVTRFPWKHENGSAPSTVTAVASAVKKQNLPLVANKAPDTKPSAKGTSGVPGYTKAPSKARAKSSPPKAQQGTANPAPTQAQSSKKSAAADPKAKKPAAKGKTSKSVPKKGKKK